MDPVIEYLDKETFSLLPPALEKRLAKGIGVDEEFKQADERWRHALKEYQYYKTADAVLMKRGFLSRPRRRTSEAEIIERYAMAYREAVLEASGRSYVEDVVAIFPPQIKRETGLDGVQVSIRDILLWVADARKITEPKTAKVLRDIAAKYYPPSEFDQDCED